MRREAPGEDNSGGQSNSSVHSLATLARVDWVDLLLIGLMLLAAVHGLRLGALVQTPDLRRLLAGDAARHVVWVPALLVHPQRAPARLITVAAVLLTGHRALGYSGGWSGATATSPCAGTTWATSTPALGVVVAVVAVLLSAWLVAGVISSPNSRFTWLELGRGPLGHPALDRPGAAPGALGLHRPAELPERPGVPPGLLHPDPAVDRAPSPRRPTPQTQALADPAIFSTVKILGTACGNEQEGSGFVVGHGPGGHQRPRGGRARSEHPGRRGRHAVRATVVLFDPSFDLAVLRTERAARPGPDHRPRPGARGTQAAILGYPEDGPLDHRRGRRHRARSPPSARTSTTRER